MSESLPHQLATCLLVALCVISYAIEGSGEPLLLMAGDQAHPTHNSSLSFPCWPALSGLSISMLQGSELVTFDQVELRFANKEEGMTILASQDSFLRHLGAFDRGARLAVDRDVSQEEFESFIVKQVLVWEPDEIERLTAAFEIIAGKLDGLKPLFPPVIFLVRTTGLEEGHTTYCRCDNAIVFGGKNFEDKEEELIFLLTHELFHIISRNSEAIRERLYHIVGFSKTSELELNSALRDGKITNPDAARNDYYFTTAVGADTVALMPLILAESPYDTKNKRVFFEYLELYFVAVENDQLRCGVRHIDGKPVLLQPSEVPGYFALIGQNTEYIIHPEEVLADNFALMITETVSPPGLSFADELTEYNAKPPVSSQIDQQSTSDAPESLPNPEIIDQMRKVLYR